MGIHLRWIIALLAALAIGQASAQVGNSNYSRYQFHPMVRCESVGSARTFCRADTARGVRIARQLSRRACIEGRTWGYNARGIWVSSGCRADFAIIGHERLRGNRYGNAGAPPVGDSRHVDNNGDVIRCDSTGDGRTYCRTEPNRRFLLSHTREGNCVEGRTWGIDERGLWVSGGCRGDFNYQR